MFVESTEVYLRRPEINFVVPFIKQSIFMSRVWISRIENSDHDFVPANLEHVAGGN